MTTSSNHPATDQPISSPDSSSPDVHQLALHAPTLADRYRSACADELALVSTFYRHPVAARTIRPGALDHTIALPDSDGVTATIRTRRARVPAGLVRDLSLRYPEYLMLGDNPVYLFTVAIRVGLHDNHPTPLAGPVHARAIAEALHGRHDAANIHPNGTDPASGAFRFSWIGDREGRVFTSPPELFNPRTRAA